MTVMYIEIVCFMSCLCGWILVCSTIPTDFWMVSEDSGSVLMTADFYHNLWKDCMTDGTGVTVCKDYASMMALSVYLHVCRALTVCSVITGFFGGVLTLIGMKCTKIGGSETASARVTFAAGITYLRYLKSAEKQTTTIDIPLYLLFRYELGAAIFIGWGGSFLLLFGGMVLSYFSGKECFQSSFIYCNTYNEIMFGAEGPGRSVHTRRYHGQRVGGVQCFAQGHFDMWTAGTEIQTFKLPVGR
uniref:Claudin n=1 Tax=Monopterus albus TaxID=43700 RepID=A0A3Q3J5Z4_MONAL